MGEGSFQKVVEQDASYNNVIKVFPVTGIEGMC